MIRVVGPVRSGGVMLAYSAVVMDDGREQVYSLSAHAAMSIYATFAGLYRLSEVQQQAAKYDVPVCLIEAIADDPDLDEMWERKGPNGRTEFRTRCGLPHWPFDL